MSVQFGRWQWRGEAPNRSYLEKVNAILRLYGPDSDGSYSTDQVNILYRGLHTTNEAHYENQPKTLRSGEVLTWDGRLDNRNELLKILGDSLNRRSTDVEIVAAAFDKWDLNCFEKLIGDWALSIWNPDGKSLILATDPMGVRHLYYSMNDYEVSWCTVLDPLVLLARKTFALCEEYVAGWFGGFSAPHLTPYVGIVAVPPSSFVLIRYRKCSVTRYWDFSSTAPICYRNNEDYEEHFRVVFAEAVRRCLRSDRPVLAELSGGIDSSSIVCMGDVLIERGEAECPSMDTVSYYDDNDPGLDELPFLTIVEQKRGRVGHHIDLGAIKSTAGDKIEQKQHRNGSQENWFSATPYSSPNQRPDFFDEYSRYFKSRGYRIGVSGMAGEDATGGYVPSPIPELQDLLISGRFLTLFCQLNAWSLKMHKPRRSLLWNSLHGLFGHSIMFPLPSEQLSPPLWIHQDFYRHHRLALHWYPVTLKIGGHSPSFQHQLYLVNHERRVLASLAPVPELARELRYPYLDRDLLMLAFAIPRQQMVGVGRRRHLMKRSLVGIVPSKLLNRKRRDAIAKSPEKSWVEAPGSTVSFPTISSSLGIIDAGLFKKVIEGVPTGTETDVGRHLDRTLSLECWLQDLAIRGLLSGMKSSSGAEDSHPGDQQYALGFLSIKGFS
jgi:asparagine synthase (glutamine-hydrolysing)